jgi:hypothetical protein
MDSVMSDGETQRSLEDERLIESAAYGDHVAFAELFGRYRGQPRSTPCLLHSSRVEDIGDRDREVGA